MYALIQADQGIFGIGHTEEEARADAAMFLDPVYDEDTGETLTARQIADDAPLISASSDAMRQACMHCSLVVVECSDAVAAKAKTHGGDFAFFTHGRRIVLESELP